MGFGLRSFTFLIFGLSATLISFGLSPVDSRAMGDEKLTGSTTNKEARTRQSNPKKILALLSSDTDIYARNLNGIQSRLRSELKINYLDNLTDQEEEIAAYFARLEKSETALVLTIGPRATRVALRHLKKIPVLFSMVQTPRNLGPLLGQSCGVAMDIPMSEYFKALKEISPRAKRVAAFYSTEQGRFLAGEGEYNDLRHGLYFEKIKVNRKVDMEKILNDIGPGLDAVFLVPDPLYDRTRFGLLSNFCKKNGIILMTGYTSLMRAGATFAITPDYNQIGEMAGDMANRILSGQSACNDEGVLFSNKSIFYLNEAFASQSNIKIPRAVSERARLTRLLNAGILLYGKGKLKSSRIVFETVLKKYPENKIALSYKEKLQDMETGARTGKLMGEARAFIKAKNYAPAISAYRKVLELNPRHRAARIELARSRRLKSEEERARGNSLAKRGEIFPGHSPLSKVSSNSERKPERSPGPGTCATLPLSSYSRLYATGNRRVQSPELQSVHHDL